MTSKLTLRYAGTDYWGRAVFLSEGGRYYKTADQFDPDCGFPMADANAKQLIIDDLHTSEPAYDFEGEPGWPIDINKFNLAMA